MRTLVAAIGAWAAGLAAYWVCAQSLASTQLRPRDFLTVGSILAASLVFLVPLGYLPLARAVLSRVAIARARVVLVVSNAALGIIPLAVVTLAFHDGPDWGGWALMGGGTVLWLTMFLAAGAGFAVLHSSSWRSQHA